VWDEQAEKAFHELKEYMKNIPTLVLPKTEEEFKLRKFKRCCADLDIHDEVSLVAHPHMNEHIQRANEMILQGIKTRMHHDL
jgi:hypothetical protein